MKKMTRILTAICTALIFLVFAVASTSTKKVISDVRYNGEFQLQVEKDEVVKNASKLDFIKSSSNPTIVLRVPNATREVLEEDRNVKTQKSGDGTNNLYDINVYNVVEKELLKGGFTVRDRALFEKVLGDKSVSDYSRIKELTETDLILELSNLQFVKYPGNIFYYYTDSKRKGKVRNQINCPNYFNLFGVKLEFRLIKVRENDFIGSFTYNYSPCEKEPCYYSINVSPYNNNCSAPFLIQGSTTISDIRLIPQMEIENFIKRSSQKMVNEITKL